MYQTELKCGIPCHVITVHVSLQMMSGVLRKVLEECERCQLSSVSIPAIGAGVLKFPNSPLDIVNAVNSYLSSAAYSGRHLKRIVLVGRDAETFKEFRGLLEVIM